MIFHFWWKAFDCRIKKYIHLWCRNLLSIHAYLHCSWNEYCTMAEPKMLLSIVSTDKCKIEWLIFENTYIFINIRKSGTTLTIFLDYSILAHTSHGTRIIHLTEKISILLMVLPMNVQSVIHKVFSWQKSKYNIEHEVQHDNLVSQPKEKAQLSFQIHTEISLSFWNIYYNFLN